MLSIITPHYNDANGIERIISQLERQSTNDWEWIIVDDISEESVYHKVNHLILNSRVKERIRLVKANKKLFGGGCRNLGVNYASSNTLVFLDADDSITFEFVKYRSINAKDFVVYANMHIKNGSKSVPFSNIRSNYLNNFLKGRFAWQTTAMVWNKDFFISIGGFNDKLERLQDVELAIRALLESKNYKILHDNHLDFYYHVSPIDVKVRTVKKVTSSVNTLILLLDKREDLSVYQKKYLKSFYFLNTRYLTKSPTKDNIQLVSESLRLFTKLKLITSLEKIIGSLLLWFYNYKIIGKVFFLKVNRKLYKVV